MNDHHDIGRPSSRPILEHFSDAALGHGLAGFSQVYVSGRFSSGWTMVGVGYARSTSFSLYSTFFSIFAFFMVLPVAVPF